MTPTAGDRALFHSSLLALSGLIVSGPVALLLTSSIAPQPPWRDVATLANHYHPVQVLPFVAGFGLLAGCTWFVAAASARLLEQGRVRSAIALLAGGVFAVMILINYTMQLAFVRASLGAPTDVTAALTMVNPRSIGWALEMVGYGALGIAMWLIAPVFPGAGRPRRIRVLLASNGIMSIAGAIATLVDLAWVMMVPGLVSFGAWNAVVALLMVAIALESRGQRARLAARAL